MGRMSQVLINALTGKVGSGTQVTGYPTYQELRMKTTKLGLFDCVRYGCPP